MSIARYSVPVAILKDNYIVAAGGVYSGTNLSKKYTNTVEIFDI